MSGDIAGFGLSLTLIASNTFPIGFPISQLADDTDPFDIPSLQVAATSMGVNGDILKWSRANEIKISISVVPAGLDDQLLAILLEANRVGRGKQGANDIITLTGIYPDFSMIMLSEGFITDGPPGSAVSSAGRLKTKTYNFSFQNKISVGA